MCQTFLPIFFSKRTSLLSGQQKRCRGCTPKTCFTVWLKERLAKTSLTKLPCEQRLHFCGMRWLILARQLIPRKCSLCSQGRYYKVNSRAVSTVIFFSLLFRIVQLSNVDEFFLMLNSKGLYLSSEKGNCVLVFTFIIKRKIWQFNVVVVQKKCDARSFANLTLSLFCCSCYVSVIVVVAKLPNFGLVCYTEGARQFEVLCS